MLSRVELEAIKTMTLNDLLKGESGHVRSVDGDGAITRRLMEMGVVPGVNLRVLKSAPFGDPIEIRLLGYNLAVRRNEAAAIKVSTDQ
jgi:ferrous iron transport protein A